MSNPNSNEDVMKEYSSMKKEWGQMKSQMSSQEKRLKMSSDELESKEKYIRKLAKEKKELAEALAAGKKELDASKKQVEQLSHVERRAETAERDQSTLLEKLSVEESRSSQLEQASRESAAELTKLEIAIAEEVKRSSHLNSENENLQKAVSDRAREEERLADSLKAALSDLEKTQKELTERSQEEVSLRENMQSLARELESKEDSLTQLQKEKNDLREIAAMRDSSQAAAVEAAKEAEQAVSEKELEHTARLAAEAEVSRLTSIVEEMEETLKSSANQYNDEISSLKLKLSTESREKQELKNTLEENTKEFEASKLAILGELNAANDALRKSKERIESTAALSASRDDAEREVSLLRLQVAEARHEIDAFADQQLVIDALTQTATELREDLELERERLGTQAASLEAAREHALDVASQSAEKLEEFQRRAFEEHADLEEALKVEAEAAVKEAERALAAEQELEAVRRELAKVRNQGGTTANARAAEHIGHEDASQLTTRDHEHSRAVENQGLRSPEALTATDPKHTVRSPLEKPSDREKPSGVTVEKFSGALPSQDEKAGIEGLDESGEVSAQNLDAMVNTVWELVEDWLSCLDCPHTLECLRNERSCLRFSPTHFHSPSSEEARSRAEATTASLLSSFDRGNAAEFEASWTMHVPPTLRRDETRGDFFSSSVRRVLIKVHAHFALFPLRERLQSAQLVPPTELLSAAQPFSDHVARYPATPVEEESLLRFRSHLADAAAADDSLTADPELLPLFALPQLPRPWLHPQLAPFLTSNSSGNPLFALAPGAGSASVATGHGLGGDDDTMNPWVRHVRSEVASLLSRHLLLTRSPALLVLHRTYLRWHSSAHVKWEEELRRSSLLRTSSRHLAALAVNLIADLEKVVEAPGVSVQSLVPSHTVQQHRRRLNSLRQALQDETGFGPEGPSNRRGHGAQSPGFDAPPIHIPKLNGYLARWLQQEHEPEAHAEKVGEDTYSGPGGKIPRDDDVPCNVVLGALGDRLTCPSHSVRESTADALATGDLFSLLAQHSHGVHPSASSVSSLGLLEPLLRNKALSILALRLVALLILHPSGHHYFCKGAIDDGAALTTTLVTLIAHFDPHQPQRSSSPWSPYTINKFALPCCACVVLIRVGWEKLSPDDGVVLLTLTSMIRRLFPPAFHANDTNFIESARGLINSAVELLLKCCRAENCGSSARVHDEESRAKVLLSLAETYAELTLALRTGDVQRSVLISEDSEVVEEKPVLTLLHGTLGALYCLVQAKPWVAHRVDVASRLSIHTALSAELGWQEHCIAQVQEKFREGGAVDRPGEHRNLHHAEDHTDDQGAARALLSSQFSPSSGRRTHPQEVADFEHSLQLPNEWGLRRFYVASEPLVLKGPR